jgi:hypothetical protein
MPKGGITQAKPMPYCPPKGPKLDRCEPMKSGTQQTPAAGGNRAPSKGAESSWPIYKK